MGQTKIEWCDKTWSPITGCTPISEGCTHCWAKRMANRLKGKYAYPKDDPFRVIFHPDRLNEPLHWKKPSRIFVCSMGDLFHEDVDDNWLDCIIGTIRDCPQHIFMMLTKRPANLKRYLETWRSEAFKNLFIGVSVENQRTADERIPILLQIPAAKRFVSVEPMLESILLTKYLVPHLKGSGNILCNSDWNKLDWVICGGETGPKARPMNLDWARSLRDQCQAAGVPFFFKSMGDWERNKTKCPCGCRRKKMSKNLIPKDLMIREFPR